ncbi:MAG: hypothetical protein IPP64_07505 [Bacteroidetes bacterium]|nr:hypothetical protein [Bacteroidota bacterium]
MKNNLLLLVCILFAYSFTPKKNAACPVKYNGIYACQLDNENSAIIRFYEDGTVLASTSVNDYMDVFSWFHKENKDMVLKGTYSVKKCSIKFEVAGMTGEQKYKGSVLDNSIDIKLTDAATKKTVSRVYTFYAL